MENRFPIASQFPFARSIISPPEARGDGENHPARIAAENRCVPARVLMNIFFIQPRPGLHFKRSRGGGGGGGGEQSGTGVSSAFRYAAARKKRGGRERERERERERGGVDEGEDGRRMRRASGPPREG